MNNTDKKQSFWKRLKLSFGGKMFKNGGMAVLVIAIALAIVIAVNMLVSLLPDSVSRLDVTNAQTYQTGDVTKEFLGTLENDVTIYYVSQSSATDATFYDFVKRYEGLSDRITVKAVDEVEQPDFVAQYTDETLSDNSLIVVSEKRSKTVSYDDVYEKQYSVDNDTYSMVLTGSTFMGENLVTSAIKYVVTDDLPTVYTVTGHGEYDLSDTYTGYLSSEGISAQSLDLLTAGIPEGAQCIIICAPETDLSEAEAAELIDFLDSGGNVLLITEWAPGAGIPDGMPNLYSLTEYMGLTPCDGVVFEGDSDMYYQYPYYIFPDMSAHDITQPLIDKGYRVAMPYAHPIEELGLYRDTIEHTALLVTSSDAWAKNITSDTATYLKEDGDPVGPFCVGMLAEEDNGETTSRLIWYSTAAVIDDTTDSNVSGGNSDLFINSVAYLCDYENAIAIHGKEIDMSSLTLSEKEIYVWLIALVVVLPVAVLAAGIFIYVKRRAR